VVLEEEPRCVCVKRLEDKPRLNQSRTLPRRLALGLGLHATVFKALRALRWSSEVWAWMSEARCPRLVTWEETSLPYGKDIVMKRSSVTWKVRRCLRSDLGAAGECDPLVETKFLQHNRLGRSRSALVNDRLRVRSARPILEEGRSSARRPADR
jgi:hypothetical protein